MHYKGIFPPLQAEKVSFLWTNPALELVSFSELLFCSHINCPFLAKEMDRIRCMWCECPDVTQRYNTDFLSHNTARISLLRPFLDSAAPFNPSCFCSRRGKEWLPGPFHQPHISARQAPHPPRSPPPSILPDAFVQSGVASELADVGGGTIGLNQPTPPMCQPPVELISGRHVATGTNSKGFNESGQDIADAVHKRGFLAGGRVKDENMRVRLRLSHGF